MLSFREYQRRSLLPLAGLALAAYYVFVFMPLARRADSLDTPLDQAWRKLAAGLDQTNVTALDFRQITNQLADTRQALLLVENAKKKTMARLELTPELRARLTAPFQLVDYQNERSKDMDRLDQAARQKKLALDPAVFAGFPEHTADIEEPSLLWAALAFTDNLVDTAMGCNVSSIHSLEVPLTLTNAPGTEPPGRWAELPVQIEFTASAENVARLLQSLPLRADELSAAGLPDGPPGKLPLFIERLILRKESPEKLDEIRVWLRVVGFVSRET
jgi:hypothetical protein